jgi:glycosyltransferase involved in cell wall biosynthesis
MRICYIAEAISIHTQRWVKYFADRGYEVHLISPMPLGDGDIGNAELHVLKRFPPQIRIISFVINLLLYVVQIRQLIRKIKPHILHAHFITDCGFWGALSGFHPFVLSAWGSDILVWPNKSRIYRSMVGFALKRADLILATGENMIEPMIKLGADISKINYILHGSVDTKKFIPKDKSQKEEYRIFDSPVVMSIRSLDPIYDLETLIRSIPLALEQIPEVKFIIAGEGVQKNYLKDLAMSLDVLDSISFVGHLPHDQIPSYLASADVYVSTSLSDGTSTSLIEAMSCGLTPVVTNVGDIEKWIANGETGFVIPVKRPDLLAEKIVYLLNNEELRDKMGKANRRLVEEKADYEKEWKKVENTYFEQIEKTEKEKR